MTFKQAYKREKKSMGTGYESRLIDRTRLRSNVVVIVVAFRSKEPRFNGKYMIEHRVASFHGERQIFSGIGHSRLSSKKVWA